MTTLRQRRPQAALQEPLLSEAPEQEGDASGLWRLLAALGPPLALLLSCAAGAAGYLSSWVWPAEAAPLSESQLQTALRLRDRALAGFEAEHATMLSELWALTVPERPLPGPRGAHWSEELGFQNASATGSPASDLRQAGLLALQCLLHFAAAQPHAFQRLRTAAKSRSVLLGYPLCVGAINLVAHLLDGCGILALPGGSKAFAPNRALATCLDKQEDAFEVLFGAAWVRLDADWVACGASVMQFNAVVAKTTETVITALDGALAEHGTALTTAHVCRRLNEAS